METTQTRIGVTRHMFHFQKGLVQTVASVRGLLRDMQSEFGEKTCLLTRRLTQDHLESFFGKRRKGRGGSNLNATSTEAKARLRLLALLFVMH